MQNYGGFLFRNVANFCNIDPHNIGKTTDSETEGERQIEITYKKYPLTFPFCIDYMMKNEWFGRVNISVVLLSLSSPDESSLVREAAKKSYFFSGPATKALSPSSLVATF